MDTDSESNHHRSHRPCRRARTERLHLMIMRTITLIIIHCSATPEGRRLDFETCRRDHIRHRGFTDIGYHFYITRDGEIHRGRPLEKVGAHCRNHNRHSIGICYEGGLSADCTPADTRTLMQKGSLLALLRELRLLFPKALIVGHHDLNPVKPCPCFDAVKEYRF
ncbi:N-acetylmuramoyl-L-alanine amidase [Phocaeicola dorei]|nr:N-acetylmuramoyl-L-alanine amidase [Phocaeicola dorei]